ncbi:MAG: response regulator [Nitrospira sp.]|nr:MAG: response regulator [Nitrospira sp.]
MPKILVADDSIAVRKVAERLLTEAGFGVTLAANGEEALAYLAKERPDVVVSDVIMPDKSGYEVCAFVRGHATLASTPVLLISGIVNHEVTKQAESCRADGVLKKPFQGTSLKDRVLELIAKRQDAAPASAGGPISAPVAAVGEPTMQMATQPLQGLHQEVHKPTEIEEQLRAERARSEELAKRLSESSEHLARAKTSEVQLAAERARLNELQETLAKVEQQVSRIPELEAALKAEQARSEELTKRLSESSEQLARAWSTWSSSWSTWSSSWSTWLLSTCWQQPQAWAMQAWTPFSTQRAVAGHRPPRYQRYSNPEGLGLEFGA